MKLCDACIYRNNVEQLKPCIIYRDDCEYYEKERGDMTREEIIERIERYIPWADEYEVDIEALKGALELLKQEPKTGHWIIYNYPGHECVYCSSCKEEYYEDDLYMGGSDFPKYCPNCGCRMVEPQESEDKE